MLAACNAPMWDCISVEHPRQHNTKAFNPNARFLRRKLASMEGFSNTTEKTRRRSSTMLGWNCPLQGAPKALGFHSANKLYNYARLRQREDTNVCPVSRLHHGIATSFDATTASMCNASRRFCRKMAAKTRSVQQSKQRPFGTGNAMKHCRMLCACPWWQPIAQQMESRGCQKKAQKTIIVA